MDKTSNAVGPRDDDRNRGSEVEASQPSQSAPAAPKESCETVGDADYCKRAEKGIWRETWGNIVNATISLDEKESEYYFDRVNRQQAQCMRMQSIRKETVEKGEPITEEDRTFMKQFRHHVYPETEAERKQRMEAELQDRRDYYIKPTMDLIEWTKSWFSSKKDK